MNTGLLCKPCKGEIKTKVVLGLVRKDVNLQNQYYWSAHANMYTNRLHKHVDCFHQLRSVRLDSTTCVALRFHVLSYEHTQYDVSAAVLQSTAISNLHSKANFQLKT